MKDFKPTYFIEQYNKIEQYRFAENIPYESHTNCIDISFLSHQLGVTASCSTIKTVAIFKVQLKDKIQN